VDPKALLADLQPWLTLIGSISVIAGTIFVVLQLRINARQAAARTAFDLVSKVTDPSFPTRRHRMYQVAAKHAAGNWTGFDRSLDDFEVRAFANIYEQLGLLVRKGVIRLPDVMEALSAQVMADWHVFEPIRSHIIERSGKVFPSMAADQAGVDRIFWPNFKWLATQNADWVEKRVSTPQ
jgi:hypothetical protein